MVPTAFSQPAEQAAASGTGAAKTAEADFEGEDDRCNRSRK